MMLGIIHDLWIGAIASKLICLLGCEAMLLHAEGCNVLHVSHYRLSSPRSTIQLLRLPRPLHVLVSNIHTSLSKASCALEPSLFRKVLPAVSDLARPEFALLRQFHGWGSILSFQLKYFPGMNKNVRKCYFTHLTTRPLEAWILMSLHE